MPHAMELRSGIARHPSESSDLQGLVTLDAKKFKSGYDSEALKTTLASAGCDLQTHLRDLAALITKVKGVQAAIS
eukprot:1631093-Amphidinium_carterae.2